MMSCFFIIFSDLLFYSSYFNDSGFWVWNGMLGVSELKDQVRCKTAVSMIMSCVGVVELVVLSFII